MSKREYCAMEYNGCTKKFKTDENYRRHMDSCVYRKKAVKAGIQVFFKKKENTGIRIESNDNDVVVIDSGQQGNSVFIHSDIISEIPCASETV